MKLEDETRAGYTGPPWGSRGGKIMTVHGSGSEPLGSQRVCFDLTGVLRPGTIMGGVSCRQYLPEEGISLPRQQLDADGDISILSVSAHCTYKIAAAWMLGHIDPNPAQLAAGLMKSGHLLTLAQADYALAELRRQDCSPDLPILDVVFYTAAASEANPVAVGRAHRNDRGEAWMKSLTALDNPWPMRGGSLFLVRSLDWPSGEV